MSKAKTIQELNKIANKIFSDIEREAPARKTLYEWEEQQPFVIAEFAAARNKILRHRYDSIARIQRAYGDIKGKYCVRHYCDKRILLIPNYIKEKLQDIDKQIDELRKQKDKLLKNNWQEFSVCEHEFLEDYIKKAKAKKKELGLIKE